MKACKWLTFSLPCNAFWKTKCRNKESDRSHPRTLLRTSDHQFAAKPFRTRSPDFPRFSCTLSQRLQRGHWWNHTICWNLREVRQVKQLISRKISQRQRLRKVLPQQFGKFFDADSRVLVFHPIEFKQMLIWKHFGKLCPIHSVHLAVDTYWYYIVSIYRFFIKKSTETGRTNFFPYSPSKFPWFRHGSHLHRLIPHFVQIRIQKFRCKAVGTDFGQ